MPDRDGYIPGVPCWIDTNQPDPDAAAEFYGGLFGWELEDTMPEGASGKYFMGRIRGRDAAAIGSIPEGAPPAAMWNTYIQVESADDTAAKVKAAGGSVITEPFDIFDAGRMAVLADPQGAVFCVWQPGRHPGSQVVNEHGAINFNDLNTNDIEGATAFYGEVFGWGTLSMGASGLFTLAAYGDHLEESDPGLKQRMKDQGAPDGFVDVVASLNPVAGRRPAALGRHLRGRRGRRRRQEGGGARRHGDRAAVRRAVGPADGDPRPGGRDLHRRPVRARERRDGRAGRRRRHGVIRARSAVSVSRSTTASSGRPRPV